VGDPGGMRHFGIPEEKILAAAARIVDGKITDQLIRIPTGEGKSRAIHQAIRRAPDAAFGNSIWDAAMLGIARRPFVINPTPQLQKIASERRWPCISRTRYELKSEMTSHGFTRSFTHR